MYFSTQSLSSNSKAFRKINPLRCPVALDGPGGFEYFRPAAAARKLAASVNLANLN